MDYREKRKRELMEKRVADRAAQNAANAVSKDERLKNADFRALERARVTLKYTNAPKWGGSNVPTLASVREKLEQAQDLLKAQDELRKPNGTLPRDTFDRACPVAAVARGEDGNGDLAEAAKKYLPAIMHCLDYRNALSGTPAEIEQGREQSLNEEEAAILPEPFPKEVNGVEMGYAPLREAIDKARDEAADFHAWAEEEIEDPVTKEKAKRVFDAKRMLPYGDMPLTPLTIAAGARKSKSQPTIALTHLATQIDKVKVCISVAPYKNGPLFELNEKMRRSGLVEAGAFTMGTTYKKELTEDYIAELCTKQVLTYSHDEKGDMLACKRFCEHARANGYVVIMIHDEAHSLVKLIEKVEEEDDKKKKIVELLRPLFSPSMTRTVLVGATLLPTLHEPSIWGSQFLAQPHDHVCELNSLLERPLQPSDKGGQYVGINDMVRAHYDDAADPHNPYAFTRANVQARMRENRPECIRVAIDSAKSALAALKKTGPKPATRKGVVQTDAEAKAEYEEKLAAAEQAVKDAEAKSVNDYLPIDDVPVTDPYMPNGTAHLFRDEVGTALLTCHTGAYIAKTPSYRAEKAHADDEENHHLCQTYLFSGTHIQKASAKDVVGGLAGYARFCTDELRRQQKPGVVMLYSSVSNAKIAETTNIEVRKNALGGNPVKLFTVLPKYTTNDDGQEEVEWEALPFSSHPDAPAALRAAHQLCADKDLDRLVPELRVIQVGYDMFKASATLSVSDLTIEFTPGVLERLHYVPGYMVLCHAKGKQLDVLYQMVGRAMNLFLSIKLPNYKVQVFSHVLTLKRIKLYYKIEEYMITCMKGVGAGPGAKPEENQALRIPNNMMVALRKFAEQQTEGYCMNVDEFLRKSRIGLRCVSLDETLPQSDNPEIGDLVPLAYIDQLEENGEENGDDDDNSMDVDDNAADVIEVLNEIFSWKHAVGRPQSAWKISGPNYKMWSDDEATRTQYIAMLTKPEQDALTRMPVYDALTGVKLKDGNYRFIQPKYMNLVPDLVHRVLPAWFSLSWALYYHKQWDDQIGDRVPTERERTDRAKATAWKCFERCWNAISYLICTGQLRLPPNTTNTSAWELLKTFAKELGDEPNLRREALNHMLRGLKWNTSQGSNHSNHVTDLLNLLERMLSTDETVGIPWNLPVFGSAPAWHAYEDDKPAIRINIKTNCVVCAHNELDLAEGSEMAHLALFDWN